MRLIRWRLSSGISDTAFLSLLLVGSLCANLWMGLRMRRLIRPESVAVTGVMMPQLTCTDLTGRPETIIFSGAKKPTVLYVFSPECHWCARNLNNIKTLAAARTDLRFIGISLSDATLNAYVQSSRLNFPVCSIPSYGSIHELKLGGTPQTIVIAPDGRVSRNWIGAYTDDELKEIQRYFGAKLPGLGS